MSPLSNYVNNYSNLRYCESLEEIVSFGKDVLNVLIVWTLDRLYDD